MGGKKANGTLADIAFQRGNTLSRHLSTLPPLLLLLLTGTVIALPCVGGTNGPVQVLESGEDHILIEIVPPTLQIEPEIRMEAFGTERFGTGIELPVFYARIALPEGTVPRSLEILASEHDEIPISRVFPGAPMRDAFLPATPLEVTESGYLRDLPYARLAVRPVRFNPARGMLRVETRILLALHLTPLEGLAQHAPLTADAPFGVPRGALLGSDLLNGGIAGGSIETDSVARRLDPVDFRLSPGAPDFPPRFKIPIERSGIVRIPAARLRREASDLYRADPRSLALSSRGMMVPLRISGGEDGRWDEGDFLEFYATALTGEGDPDQFQRGDWTDTNVYWLQIDPTRALPALRRDSPYPRPLASAATSVRTRDFARDTYFYGAVPRPGDDHWVWDQAMISSGSSAVREIGFDLPDLVPGRDSGSLSVRLVGRTTLDHRMTVALDGAILGTAEWKGFAGRTATFPIAPGALREHSTLRLEVAAPGEGDVDRVALDGFAVTYPHRLLAEGGVTEFTTSGGPVIYQADGFASPEVAVYDVTDPGAPVWLPGGIVAGSGPFTLLLPDSTPSPRKIHASDPGGLVAPPILRVAPAGLKSRAARADWLVVTPRSFLATAGLDDLANLRAARGLVPRVVALEDIYDEFSHGIATPVGIRDFLSWTLRYWERPAPSYVLLLGDASVDTKNRYGRQDFGNPVPTWFVDRPDGPTGVGYRASDSLLACVRGSDALPDIHIGRLPARTPEEAETMLRKVIRYETLAPAGEWRTCALLLADVPDTNDEWVFESAQSEVGAEWLLPPYAWTRLYYRQMPFGGTDQPAFTDRLIEEIHRGAALVQYLGEGHFTAWSSRQLLTTSWPGHPRDDLDRLRNQDLLPFLVEQGSSMSGGFFHPLYDSLAERLVKKEDGGAVAAFTPSGVYDSTLVHRGSRAIFEAIFGLDKVRTLGPITLRYRLALDPLSRDATEGMTLLGDPATELVIPAPPPPPGVDVRAGDRRNDLTWDEAEWPVSGYAVYRSTEGFDGAYERIAIVQGFSLLDRGLVNGMDYFYRVASVDPEGFEGPASRPLWARPRESGVPPPTILYVNPDTGPESGGTLVTVYGRDFLGSATASFDGLAVPTQYVNSNVLRAHTPPHGPGPADVAVTHLDGQRDVLPGAYRFCPPGEGDWPSLDQVRVWKSRKGLPMVSWPAREGDEYTVLVAGRPDMGGFRSIAQRVSLRSVAPGPVGESQGRIFESGDGTLHLAVPLGPKGDPILGAGNADMEFVQVIVAGGCGGQEPLP